MIVNEFELGRNPMGYIGLMIQPKWHSSLPEIAQIQARNHGIRTPKEVQKLSGDTSICFAGVRAGVTMNA
jgi:hypothetical protein